MGAEAVTEMEEVKVEGVQTVGVQDIIVKMKDLVQLAEEGMKSWRSRR